VQRLSSLRAKSILLAAVLLGTGRVRFAMAQTTQPAPTTAPIHSFTVAPELKGRRVEAIRIVGNRGVSDNVIMNVVRTREGQAFDPATVEEDYQRIFDLKRFSNVEAKVEPTTTGGVIVVFIVTEERLIKSIVIRGNVAIDTKTLSDSISMHPGEASDQFRLALATQSVVNLYKDKNYPYAHVIIDDEALRTKGDLIFNIVEGPKVRVRKVAFVGARSFTQDRLHDVVKTKYWIWILRPGTLDSEQIEDDIGALRKYYTDHGFFDVRVGRKIIVSPDQTEVQVNFIVDEGRRYTVRNILFQGNASVPESKLRGDLKITPGRSWDADAIERDVRSIVKAYSPFGFVYEPDLDVPNPDYLAVNPRRLFVNEPGKFDLIYDIHEGKPFHMGRVIVKGNDKSQQKIVLREMRVSPGQLYNSSALNEATDRLKGLPYFSSVTVTPIGDDPGVRDVLVEVKENKTAIFTVGAGINSNGGIVGDITYEQRNFDIANPPDSWKDIFTDQAFSGAGQNLRINLEPGTVESNASIRISDPYLFDQPYSGFNEVYLHDWIREHYDERHMGDAVGIGKRFDYINSMLLTLRGEDVDIRSIEFPQDRATQILQYAGHNTVTSAALQFRRNTTQGGLQPYAGYDFTAGIEQYGALGGDFWFQKWTSGYNLYQTVYTDMLDRKTIINYHAQTGFITGDAPFFEKFFDGGIGTIRGFEYRGVSPRAGRFNDRVGGDFSLTGGVEMSFPIAGEIFRGVVFTDLGTDDTDVQLGTIRSSVGAGIRLSLPFFGQAPLAVDFAIPVTKGKFDDTQLISFSFGLVP
jgi:outer membrane protein insertion porin family